MNKGLLWFIGFSLFYNDYIDQGLVAKKIRGEFKDGTALAFFPCKIIEIIDIYNALTHDKRNSHLEAMKILKKSFIAHNLKIDPLIFEIFLEFKQECGLISISERKEIDAIIY